MSIAILDFGSQTTQLIARRVRALERYSTILPYDTSFEELKDQGVMGIILSGGPHSVLDEDAPTCDPEIFSGKIPVLGICYGLQLMVHTLGGEIAAGEKQEYGRATIKYDLGDPLGLHIWASYFHFEDVVWMSHGDHAKKLPDGFRAIAYSKKVPAAISNVTGRLMGFQYHPEVEHTFRGSDHLDYWLSEICRCPRDWKPGDQVPTLISGIQETVGEDIVVLGVSGGVDSMVVATLLHEAIGDQLHCVFVDNGLLREGEREDVESRFKIELKTPLITYDASHHFLGALEGVSDPEKKRKIIGRVFVDAFKAAVSNMKPKPKFLAQGTLYPDVVESQTPGGAPSVTIKTHHNVGGLPKDLGFELLEPLRWMFKDEVRELGAALGLSPETLGRHPFPGPGLAIRILGEVTPKALAIVRAADSIFMEELIDNDYYNKVSQALAVLLPIRSVGVMGDARTYDQVIALRAVTTRDFMTARPAQFKPGFLDKVSTRIINEVEGVNRVVYDISCKPPATIEWE